MCAVKARDHENLEFPNHYKLQIRCQVKSKQKTSERNYAPQSSELLTNISQEDASTVRFKPCSCVQCACAMPGQLKKYSENPSL